MPLADANGICFVGFVLRLKLAFETAKIYKWRYSSKVPPVTCCFDGLSTTPPETPAPIQPAAARPGRPRCPPGDAAEHHRINQWTRRSGTSFLDRSAGFR